MWKRRTQGAGSSRGQPRERLRRPIARAQACRRRARPSVLNYATYAFACPRSRRADSNRATGARAGDAREREDLRQALARITPQGAGGERPAHRGPAEGHKVYTGWRRSSSTPVNSHGFTVPPPKVYVPIKARAASTALRGSDAATASWRIKSRRPSFSGQPGPAQISWRAHRRRDRVIGSTDRRHGRLRSMSFSIRGCPTARAGQSDRTLPRGPGVRLYRCDPPRSRHRRAITRGKREVAIIAALYSARAAGLVSRNVSPPRRRVDRRTTAEFEDVVTIRIFFTSRGHTSAGVPHSLGRLNGAERVTEGLLQAPARDARRDRRTARAPCRSRVPRACERAPSSDQHEPCRSAGPSTCRSSSGVTKGSSRRFPGATSCPRASGLDAPAFSQAARPSLARPDDIVKDPLLHARLLRQHGGYQPAQGVTMTPEAIATS